MDNNQYEEVQRALREFNEKAKSWTREQCLEYLFSLGTHNRDGTLTKEYGGDENT